MDHVSLISRPAAVFFSVRTLDVEDNGYKYRTFDRKKIKYKCAAAD